MQFVCRAVFVDLFVENSKRGKFRFLLRLGLVRFSRVNRMSRVTVCVEITVSLVLVITWSWG